MENYGANDRDEGVGYDNWGHRGGLDSVICY